MDLCFSAHCLFLNWNCVQIVYTLFILLYYVHTCTSPVLARDSVIQGVWVCIAWRKTHVLTDIYPCMYRGAGPFFHTRIHSKAQMPQILLHNCGGTPCGDRYVHHGLARAYTDKKEKFSSYIRKLRWDRLQSHI